MCHGAMKMGYTPKWPWWQTPWPSFARAMVTSSQSVYKDFSFAYAFACGTICLCNPFFQSVLTNPKQTSPSSSGYCIYPIWLGVVTPWLLTEIPILLIIIFYPTLGIIKPILSLEMSHVKLRFTVNFHEHRGLISLNKAWWWSITSMNETDSMYIYTYIYNPLNANNAGSTHIIRQNRVDWK